MSKAAVSNWRDLTGCIQYLHLRASGDPANQANGDAGDCRNVHDRLALGNGRRKTHLIIIPARQRQLPGFCQAEISQQRRG